MRHIVHPQQSRLFDTFEPVLTEKTRQRLLTIGPAFFAMSFLN